MKTKEKFLLKLKETIETDVVIDMETEFRNLDEWDSLALLSLIAFLDEDYGLIIEGDDFDSLQTIGEIWLRVLSRQSNLQ